MPGLVCRARAIRPWSRGWNEASDWLVRIPYPVLRPAVHAAHWARILTLALTEHRPLVVHETATRPGSRLVWIDVLGGAALRGQVDRPRGRPAAITAAATATASARSGAVGAIR